MTIHHAGATATLAGVILVVLGGCGGTRQGSIAAEPSADSGSIPADPSVEASAAAQSGDVVPRPLGTVEGAPLGYLEYLPPGYGDGEPRPLLVFVHGRDESGDGSAAELEKLFATGIPDLIQSHAWPEDRPFVVLAPQHDFPREDEAYDACGSGQHFGSCMVEIQHELDHPANGSLCMTPAELYAFLAYAIPAYDVDPQRVYLTGLSCGAYAVYEYVAEHGASQVAAVVAIAGDARPAWEASGCALGEVAIWGFHGDADYELDPKGTIDPMTDLMDCPQPPRQEVELTVYPGVDHESWTRTYDLSAGHDIYAWLLDQESD